MAGGGHLIGGDEGVCGRSWTPPSPGACSSSSRVDAPSDKVILSRRLTQLATYTPHHHYYYPFHVSFLTVIIKFDIYDCGLWFKT